VAREELDIEQGDIDIEVKHCDAGLGYIMIRNNSFDIEVSTQLTRENKKKIADFLLSE
jgi:hypothetical protein